MQKLTLFIVTRQLPEGVNYVTLNAVLNNFYWWQSGRIVQVLKYI